MYEYFRFIVELYHAEPVVGFTHLHGRKGTAMVHVGATDAPVTVAEVSAALDECRANGVKALDVLGWEWEMGLNSTGLHDLQRDYGVEVRLFHIPHEVMDKRAVDAGDVHFYEAAYVEAEAVPDGAGIRIKNAGVAKWREFEVALSGSGHKPVMFVMAENTTAAHHIAAYLETLPGFTDRVLEIHTNARGDIVEGKSKAKKDEIEALRKAARDVDGSDNPYAAIVSVLMLREGWDVKNVVVIVPLRAYTAKAQILPEQTLGRGLRRMTPPASGDIHEMVVVIEQPAFREFWRKELKEEGLDIQWVPVEQVRPNSRTVAVDRTKLAYDIEVPLLSPALVRSVARLDLLTVDMLEVSKFNLPERSTLGEDKIHYTGRHMFTGVVVEEADFERDFPVEPSGYLSVLIRLIERETRLTGQFARLAPLMKACIEHRLFGRDVVMDDEVVMRVLNRPDLKKELFEAFVKAINDLSIEEQNVVLEPSWIKASATNAFATTRQCAEGGKTVFNLVPYANRLEGDFVALLDSRDAEDVLAYFKNETAVHFDIEYLGVAGGLRRYVPDFVVRCGDGVTYIIETKGQEDLEVARKDQRARRWCADATALTGAPWAYIKVPDGVFRAYPVHTFGELIRLVERQ